tara:strand:- start:120 stop:335 length:216 start_codon:yes stop_codon:yes gene_type:complete
MAVKIKQLLVKGNLNDSSSENENKNDNNTISEKKIDELKKYVDQSVSQSFKQMCDSTVNKILETIHKKSDF